jgi:hypothetical protein
MSLRFNRRTLMRGMVGGAAVCVGIPGLDLFLDGNGTAYANGAKLPTRFGTYFWGLGLTSTEEGNLWVPAKTGPDFDLMPQLECLAPFKNKVSVFSGFRVIGDGRPNLVHWSGHASILAGAAPQNADHFEGPSFDTVVADAIGTGTRIKALDLGPSGKSTSYSTRTGKSFATPETTPVSLYMRLFGDGFQDPNRPDWKPDPDIVLRQSVLSAITEQRQALMASLGKADRVKLDQYFTSLRETENSLAIQLERPEKREACAIPSKPMAGKQGISIDLVNAHNKQMAKLLAMGLACNQTKVFNVVHSSGPSETYLTGDDKTYHQRTHDEPTDPKLGYQPVSSKLAGMTVQGLGDFLAELEAIKEGDGTLLDHSLVFAFSDTGYAKIHSLENIPMIIAGGANGKHKGGQHIASKGEAVTRVSLTAQQLAGAPVGEFGYGAMKTSTPISEVMA